MNTPECNESTVARLLREIDLNYQAASLGLSGLALGTSMHSFIAARMERIEGARQELAEVLDNEEEATRLVVEVMDKSAQ